MKITEKIVDKIAVITVGGKMMGPDSLELHEHVKRLVSDGIANVVVDLSKVKMMNSTGLGALMASFGTVTKNGGFIRLSGVEEKIKSLLMITHLITFFETYESSELAVASFKK